MLICARNPSASKLNVYLAARIHFIVFENDLYLLTRLVASTYAYKRAIRQLIASTSAPAGNGSINSSISIAAKPTTITINGQQQQ